jgi:flagellar basal-body rod protein FlgB
MPTQSLFDGTIAALQLNAGSLRHKVLTSNIANIDTPNYKAFEVVMEDALKRNNRSAGSIEMVRTRPRHLSGRHSSSNPIKIKTVDSTGNNFRADYCIEVLLRLLKRNFKGLKMRSKEGVSKHGFF